MCWTAMRVIALDRAQADTSAPDSLQSQWWQVCVDKAWSPTIFLLFFFFSWGPGVAPLKPPTWSGSRSVWSSAYCLMNVNNKLGLLNEQALVWFCVVLSSTRLQPSKRPFTAPGLLSSCFQLMLAKQINHIFNSQIHKKKNLAIKNIKKSNQSLTTVECNVK